MTNLPDHDWEELFQKHLTAELLSPVAAERVRQAVRHSVAESRERERWGRLDPARTLRLSRVAAGALALLVVLLMAAALIPAPPPRAMASIHGGTARLTDGRTGRAQPLSDGASAVLEPGDEIAAETGAATITYFAGQTTELRPGARATLITLAQRPDGHQVELTVWRGRALSRVLGRLGPIGRFQVNSPSAQATVRGTEFIVEALSESETFIAAQSGTILLRQGVQEVEVHAGEQVLAVAGQPLEVKQQQQGGQTMQTLLDQIYQLVGAYIPSIVGALIILIVGWLVAAIISGIVRRVLRRTSINTRLSKWLGTREGGGQAEDAIATGVFYLIMLFVLIAFFQTLRLELITQPLNSLLTQLLAYLPRLIGAVVLLLLAWVIATILRRVIQTALSATNLDERFGSPGLAKTLADVAYYLTFLLFLPGILDALSLSGLLTPIQGMINTILGFLPNLAAAAVIAVVGLFVARLLRQIVTSLLAAVGVDRLSGRLGIAAALGQQQVSTLLGLVVYVLILIPILTAALNALNLDALTAPISNMLNQILAILPNLFAAAVILALAYVIARVVSNLLAEILAGAGFNSILARLGLSQAPAPGQRTPSQLVGYLILVAIMLFAVMEASRVIGLASLAELLMQFVVFAGQVLMGLIIFGVGLYVANLAAQVVRTSGARQASLLALVTRAAILVLAGAMALRQMGLANEIINLGFGLLLGAIAVATAIAFGLGGRQTARRWLEAWSQSLNSEAVTSVKPPTAQTSPPAKSGPA